LFLVIKFEVHSKAKLIRIPKVSSLHWRAQGGVRIDPFKHLQTELQRITRRAQ